MIIGAPWLPKKYWDGGFLNAAHTHTHICIYIYDICNDHRYGGFEMLTQKHDMVNYEKIFDDIIFVWS